MMKKNLLIAVLFFAILQLNAEEKYRLPGKDPSLYVPSAENLKARERFQDMKFGIFVHWGLYSMLGQGEWVMNNRNIKRGEYEKLARAFYPSEFDAAKWVKIFKSSGAEYMTITTRHHDGFSLFKSEMSKYNSVDATPFARDIIKEISEQCKKQNLGLHLYYSHADWYREDYPVGWTGRGTGRDTTKADWNGYKKFMNGQLKELLTKYGSIGAIWFDGYWDHADVPDFDWELDKQYDMIHALQPACLIGNNHHVSPYYGEDFQMFERDLPGENKAGLSPRSEIGSLPLETCVTLSKGAWGYSITEEYNTAEYAIRTLVESAGRNANLLLNVGPRPDGTIPEKVVEILGKIGNWLQKYGETIYGTRGGFIPPAEWGVTTLKGNKLYVHVLNPGKTPVLDMGKRKIKSVRKFTDKTKVPYTLKKGILTLTLPENISDTDFVVEIEYVKK